MFRVAPFILSLVLLLGSLVPSTAHAAEQPRTCIAPAAQASDPAAFDCSDKQLAHGPGDFVAKLVFSPRALSPANPLVLRFAAIWQDGGQITFRYADGSLRGADYNAASAARHLSPGGVLEFPVPHSPAKLIEVLVSVEGSANYRGVLLGAELIPASSADSINHTRLAAYAAFGGLVVALLVFNFSLWISLRHGFQLRYCAMVAAVAVYAASASGLLMQLVPGIDGNDRLRINIVMLALFGVSALYFVRSFFDDAGLGKRLERLISVVSIAGLGSALAFAALSPWLALWTYRAFSVAMIAMVLSLVPILIHAVRQRSRYVGLFVLAWSLPACIAVLRAFHGLGLIGYSFLLDNSNLIALATEALCSSLILTARLRDLSTQRDIAIAGERNARRLAGTDPLTGLLNRRAFIDMAIGRNTVQRLLLIDVDRFKDINDSLGHDAGDEVLVAIGAVIQQFRPARSLAVRLGGEEFAILAPAAGHGADSQASALLEAVRNHVMPMGARVTVSIGVADGRLASEDDWKRLYRLADTALYRAKADGRDRVCRATDFREAA